MRIIVDTNVLVSAVLRDKIPQDVILFIAGTPDFEWMASREILQEYKDVLTRKKFDLSETVLKNWFVMLDELVHIVEVDLKVDFERDRKDAKFLACALGVDADWLITGDKDFEDAVKMGNTTIMNAAMFKRTVIAGWRS